MSPTNIRDLKSSFDVLETAKNCQTAVMTLAPGEESGPKQNEHPQSEQVLYLVEGELEAEIGDRRLTMHAGDSVIVGMQTPHRFSNRSGRPALTFNVYAPPAY
jgi:mannose-6-phosphate isomerase-like protein (cupin superfamily)